MTELLATADRLAAVLPSEDEEEIGAQFKQTHRAKKLPVAEMIVLMPRS
jgi:hypothetical protein